MAEGRTLIKYCDSPKKTNTLQITYITPPTQTSNIRIETTFTQTLPSPNALAPTTTTKLTFIPRISLNTHLSTVLTSHHQKKFGTQKASFLIEKLHHRTKKPHNGQKSWHLIRKSHPKSMQQNATNFIRTSHNDRKEWHLVSKKHTLSKGNLRRQLRSNTQKQHKEIPKSVKSHSKIASGPNKHESHTQNS